MKDASALLYHPTSLGIEAGFFESLLKKSVREGEEKLMLAVLEDAVTCFQKYVLAKDPRGKALFRGAEDWILEQNSDWIFSFASICEVLGLSPEYVRQGLMRWKEGRLTAAPKAKIYHLRPRRRKRKSSPETASGDSPSAAPESGRIRAAS
jgi:hypothetical protein